MDERIGQRLHALEGQMIDAMQVVAGIKLDLAERDARLAREVEEVERFLRLRCPPERPVLRVIDGAAKRRTARRGKLRLVS